MLLKDKVAVVTGVNGGLDFLLPVLFCRMARRLSLVLGLWRTKEKLC